MKRIVCALLTMILVLYGVALAEDPAKEAAYQRGLQLMEAGEYDMAVTIFEMLDGYSDSAAQIIICQSAKFQLYYDRAQELFAAGEYDAAKEVYLMLGDYKDSAVQVIRCETQKKQVQYDAAAALADSGQYEKALEAFKLLGDYSDSPARVEQMEQALLYEKYKTAAALQDAGRYDEAIAAYEELNNYRDTADRIAACREQLYIAQLGGQIENKLSTIPFDTVAVYALLKEARQYGLDENALAGWYAKAYDAESKAKYGSDFQSMDQDLDHDGKTERIVSASGKLLILKKGENGLELLASAAAPVYETISTETDPSGRVYLKGCQNDMLDIYLLEPAPALITSVKDSDGLALEWTVTGFAVAQRLTDEPVREKTTEYIVLSGSVFNALESPVTVDMATYPQVDSGYKLMTLYQEAMHYQNDTEINKLVSDQSDSAAISQINEWLAGKVIDSAPIVLWNPEADDYICVVFSGSNRLNVRVKRTEDGQFRLLGLI